MIKELTMQTMTSETTVVVLHVGCKGKRTEFQKGWKKEAGKASSRKSNVGREFGK